MTAVPAPTPSLSPTSSAVPQSPQPTSAPPITALPEPPVDSHSLVLWAAIREEQVTALKQIIAEWSRQHAVDVVVVRKTSDALQADIRANLLTGQALPDAILGTQEDLGLLQQSGLLQPAEDGLSDADFIPAAIEGATIGQQRWGTPVTMHGFLLLLYNRHFVDHPPRTTDDLILLSRQLVSRDRYGLVSAWVEPRWLMAWLTGFDGALVADDDSTPLLDTPSMQAALSLLRELRTAGPPAPSTYDDGVALFSQGRAAFAIDGDWAIPLYRGYTQTLDLGIAPLPIVPATGRVAASPLGGVYLLYSSHVTGTHLEQARALGVVLTQPAVQAQLAGAWGQLPSLRAALTDPIVVGDPMLAAAAAQIEGARGLPPDPALRCAWQAIGAELPPMLIGEITQEEAAHLMQASANNCMATYH